MPSIEQRGPNSWRLIVEDPTVPGKRTQRKKTVRIDDPVLLKSKRDLKKYLEDELHNFKKEVESGEYIKPERMTFREFVPVWKKNYAVQNLGAYTRRNYLAYIDTHLIPVFGDTQMVNIKTMQIVSFMTRLRGSEGRKDGRKGQLATNTVLNIFKALKSILDAAKKWRIIATNPIEGVERPAPDKKEKRAIKARKKSYTREEAEKAVLALYEEPENWRLYFIGAMLGGFRRGELLGVEEHNVDFEIGGFHLEKQITLDEDGSVIEDELKTVESEGFVPLPRWYMDELKSFLHNKKKARLQMGSKWKGGNKNYIFCNKYGERYYPNTPSLTWRRLLERLQLPPIRLHDLRHTTAMVLRGQGVDLKKIQELLRHTKLSTTADIYAVSDSDQIDRETADSLESLNPRRVRSQSVPNA